MVLEGYADSGRKNHYAVKVKLVNRLITAD